MSWFQILSLITAATSVVALAGTPNVYAGSRRGSCYDDTAADDTCCYSSPARLIQTQVWDTQPVTGPLDSWTVGGLWPIHNDGSLPTHCDTNRTYTNITQILYHAGAEDTIDDMNQLWESPDGDNDELWQDQWAKHGTCFSTLSPECFSHYEVSEEAAPYFKKAMSLHKRLPTYDWLRDDGIIPSYSMFYRLSDIQDTLEDHHGSRVSLRCAGQRIREIGYHFNVTGTLQDGFFTDSGAFGDLGDCPELVLYEPKGDPVAFTNAVKLLRSIFRPTIPLYRNMTRATATWNGKVLAETDTFETVEGNIYFPASSIHKENFRESSHETVCGWKGTASYYDIVVDDKVNKEAAWYYANPKDAAKNIAGMVAFWKGVEVKS